MKLTFKLPLPDHHPKAAFEYLTGYGFVEIVDPVLGEFTYSIEDETMGALMRRLREIDSEMGAYDWWCHGNQPDLFEMAQEQINSMQIVNGEMTKTQQKLLIEMATPALGVKKLPPDRLAALNALKKFKPVKLEDR